MNSNTPRTIPATATDRAIAFIAWLRPQIKAVSNCRRYALHLTDARTTRLQTPIYPGPYNLFELNSYDEAATAIHALSSTNAYHASKRANGGNGVFQATFTRFLEFWQDLEAGIVFTPAELAAAATEWQTVQNSIQREHQNQ